MRRKSNLFPLIDHAWAVTILYQQFRLLYLVATMRGTMIEARSCRESHAGSRQVCYVAPAPMPAAGSANWQKGEG